VAPDHDIRRSKIAESFRSRANEYRAPNPNPDRRPTFSRGRDPTCLFVEFVNAGDAEGLAGLYEPDAAIAFPPGQMTVGRPAILALYQQMVAARPHFEAEAPLLTLLLGDLALTATAAHDEAGARAQVARRQADGSWLRVLDRPDFRG
jgi:ketosteroid isomerase-like protein